MAVPQSVLHGFGMIFASFFTRQRWDVTGGQQQDSFKCLLDTLSAGGGVVKGYVACIFSNSQTKSLSHFRWTSR